MKKTFNITEEDEQLFLQLFEAEQNNREGVYTQGMFFAELLRNLVDYEGNQQRLHQLTCEYTALNEKYTECLQQEPTEVEVTKEVYTPIPLEENQQIITIPHPTSEILTEVCKRLSERFHKDVTPENVLLDGFIRYIVEQYQEWFFPFVIKPQEFEAVCGYSHEQLLKWLHNGK